MSTAFAGRFVALPLPLPRWRDVPAHAVMLVAMIGTMAAGHSDLADLAALGLLLVALMVCARVARDDAVFREHLVDMGAMAVLLVGCLPGHSAIAGTSAGIHDHFALPTGPFVIFVALVGWLLGRALLWRRTRSGRSAAIASGVFVAAGLILMVVFCAHPA